MQENLDDLFDFDMAIVAEPVNEIPAGGFELQLEGELKLDNGPKTGAIDLTVTETKPVRRAKIKSLSTQDLSSDYSQIVSSGIDLPLEKIQDAVDSRDMVELSRLIGPVLVATAARSAMWHMRSDNLDERKLGNQQLKTILPFVMPKLEQVEINASGAVASDIVSYMDLMRKKN